ncbi:MAG: formylglycine-generating enzyme family protein, partial [Candidatus Binatia bacterium]
CQIVAAIRRNWMRRLIVVSLAVSALLLALAPLAFTVPPLACPPDMVQAGPICVDTYEASVWQTKDAKIIEAIRTGKIARVEELRAGATQHGGEKDDYGEGCPDNGNGCKDFYAVSIPGVMPARYLTWFQAVAACRNAGKRLLSNAEWQMAALGTPDPGADGDGVKGCNTTKKTDAVLTGAVSVCVSDVGAFDMVGNVWEWVGDWMQDNGDTEAGDQSSRTYGQDAVFGIDEAVPHGDRFPAAWIRGGSYAVPTGTDAGVFALRANISPSHFRNDMGFRCGR